jgi:hypothetical protein
LAKKISNIRYGKRLGTIEFECAGTSYVITEPSDVLLVGFNDELAAQWIAKNYGFLLITYERMDA